MKLTYIYHSCFLLETESCSIIFDYYKDTPNAVIQRCIMNATNKIYVFSSHSHRDHYNERILFWKALHSDITYIFSKDILDEGRCKATDAVFLNKFDVYQDENIKVKAFGSTDLGVSFAVEMDGKTIFHAGDLNNWHWNEESTPKEVEEAETAYLKELADLASSYNHFDIAMFPVDPRLGKDFMRGATQFLEQVKVDLFVPMHCWEKYDEANKFSKIATQFGSRFFEIKAEGDFIIA